jgi:hypothetical protein
VGQIYFLTVVGISENPEEHHQQGLDEGTNEGDGVEQLDGMKQLGHIASGSFYTHNVCIDGMWLR